MQIAQTILQQLGGKMFTLMTGSNNFVASQNSIKMNLKGNKAKAKWLKITLNEMDTYDMLFFTADKQLNIIVKAEKNNIYCDQLQDIFTQVTGLYTRL
jgi:hypothetical protein